MKQFIWLVLVVGITLYFQTESVSAEGLSQVKQFELGLSALIVLV